MPPKTLCAHFSASQENVFFCLLKHAVIPSEYAERVCKGGEPLTEACIKAYEIDKVKKAIDERVTIDKLITVENMNTEVQKIEDISSASDDKELDFLEELLLKVPDAKANLKKMTKPSPPLSPTSPPPRPKLSPPPPPPETTIIKTKNYSEKAEDYESMAQKMRDSELYSEAAIDICCASLAWMLANDIPQAIRSLKVFVDTLDISIKEQVTEHPAFLVARALISATYHKDHGKFYEAEVYTRDLYSKLQYGEDRIFIAEAMKKIEEMLKNQW